MPSLDVHPCINLNRYVYIYLVWVAVCLLPTLNGDLLKTLEAKATAKGEGQGRFQGGGWQSITPPE